VAADLSHVIAAVHVCCLSVFPRLTWSTHKVDLLTNFLKLSETLLGVFIYG
jgi:hypothetical protein